MSGLTPFGSVSSAAHCLTFPSSAVRVDPVRRSRSRFTGRAALMCRTPSIIWIEIARQADQALDVIRRILLRGSRNTTISPRSGVQPSGRRPLKSGGEIWKEKLAVTVGVGRNEQEIAD